MITKRTLLVQVFLNDSWQWLFCREMPGNKPATCSDWRKAQKAGDGGLEYFQRHMGNHQFRAIKPVNFNI